MRSAALLGDTLHIIHYFFLTDLLKTAKSQITRFTAKLVLSAFAGKDCFVFYLNLWYLVGSGIYSFHSRLFHVLVDQYPQDHQLGAVPVQLCLHLYKMGWWGNGEVVWSLLLEFAPFPKFHARKPAADEHISIGVAAQFWETWAVSEIN